LDKKILRIHPSPREGMIGSLKRQWGDTASGKSLATSEFLSPYDSWYRRLARV